MNPNEYQQLALRTMADQCELWTRAYEAGVMGTQLDNALRGLMDEVGELAGAVKAWIEYGKPLDPLNLKEEIGDCLWRLAQACDAIGITLEQAMEANIAKLQKRYPEKYTDALAAEENRDRQAEREALQPSKSSPYGYCPICGAPGASRERRPNGNDTCLRGHTYTSRDSRNSDGVVSLKQAITEARETIEQTGHGFAEPPEEIEPLKRKGYATVAEYRAETGKLVGRSYDRMCIQCGLRPVHKSNVAGLCPDCAQANRFNISK